MKFLQESSKALVDVLLTRGAGSKGKQKLVARYVSRSQELKQQAAQAAGANDYQAAIMMTREAIAHLNRGLKLMGVHMTQ